MTSDMFPNRGGCPRIRTLENERAIRHTRVLRTNCQRAGFELGFRAAAPAPAADYDTWLASVFSKRPAKRKIDGHKLRRAVIMRRNGFNVAEASRSVGIGASALGKWLDMLPPELAV